MKKITNFKNSHEFSKRINELIPAGAHTYSKGDDQFPYNSPKGIVKGKGVRVWDVDGNEYIDWTMGLTAVSLGHAYEPVIEAVSDQLQKGANFQRPAEVELEFAELLSELFPKLDMFKFAKNGSTVTTAAVKLARAYTGRKYVAVCAEQPFFSYDDWFIGSTVCDAGIPEATKALTLKFNYNDIESVKKLFSEYKNQISCLIMEAVKFEEPTNDFLHQLQEECKKNGVVFILDEMITGFRMDLRGAAEYFDLEPDLVTYGKAIGNGFSVAVLGGKRHLMELGGTIPGKERVFLVSTTHGSETHALSAAIATIKLMREKNVSKHYWEMGKLIISKVQKILKEKGLEEYIEIIGLPWWPVLAFKDQEKEVSLPFKTLFLQEMIKRGFLFQGTFTLAYQHTENEIEETMVAFEEACEIYKVAVAKGSVDQFLVGDPIKLVFRKTN